MKILLAPDELRALRKLIHHYGRRAWKREVREGWTSARWTTYLGPSDTAALQTLRNRVGVHDSRGAMHWLSRVTTLDVLDQADTTLGKL